MANNTLVQYPGRYSLESITLSKPGDEVIITELVAEFNIYSSLYDVSNVLEITMLDAQNLLTDWPIEAGNTVDIEISYADESHRFNFRVTKIESIGNHDRQRTYNLICISNFAFISSFAKISRAYSGLTSSIARAVFDSAANEYEIEQTRRFGVWDRADTNQHLVIPNWSPAHAINWLAQRSNITSKNVRFLFFQNSKQAFNFMPIEKAEELYKGEAPITYSYNMETFYENDAPNSSAIMENILHLDYHDSFDITTALAHGRLFARRHTIDVSNKRQDIYNYNYWNDFDRGGYLNPDPIWGSYMKYAPGAIQYDNVASKTVGNNLNKVDGIANLKVTTVDDTQSISIIIKGNNSVDIGQVVNIAIPSPQPQGTNTNVLDDRWSGRYYVIAKRDMFTIEAKQTVLTLAKESVGIRL